MFKPEFMPAYRAWFDECNQYDASRYLPFIIAEHDIGMIHHNDLPLFEAMPAVFVVENDSVSLRSELDTEAKRTQALDTVCRQWRDREVFFGWRDEPYKIATDFHAPALCLIERAATSVFGVNKYGVHLNGYTLKDGEIHMWIGRRSRHSPTYPSALDHIVAGGLGAAYSAWETLIKESQEEADISEAVAQQSKPVGLISYCNEREGRLNRDNLFIYDLLLPEDFVPRNTDGETEEFYCMPLEEVAERVAKSREFKINVNLVLIDFLVRHGYIPADAPEYVSLCQQMRRFV